MSAKMSPFGRSETFQHRNGHTSGLAHYGDVNGPPVFYFHGLPSSRLEAALLDNAAKQVGAHIIAIDRPGVGMSSPMPKRTLLDWPPLVVEIAEHFGYEQFHVLGASAGGPYALACAKDLCPSKLKGVGVISGMSPVVLGLGGMSFGSRFAVYATKWLPWVGRKLYDWTVIPAAQNADPTVFEKLLTDGLSQLSDSDKALFKDNHLKQKFVEAAREHFRQGNKPLLDEWRIFVADWGFELKTVEQAPVHFWCGTEDVICPIDLSRRMAAQIEGAQLTAIEGGTHYSVLAKDGEKILRQLLQEEVSAEVPKGSPSAR